MTPSLEEEDDDKATLQNSCTRQEKGEKVNNDGEKRQEGKNKKQETTLEKEIRIKNQEMRNEFKT